MYIYERGPGGWTETTKMGPPAVGVLPGFGTEVAVSGSTLAVGAVGSLHLHERTGTGWQIDLSLEPLDPDLVNWFGASAALNGDDLVVGAPKASVPSGPSYTGAVHVFRREPSGWAGVVAMPSGSSLPWANFGTQVAVDGGMLPWTGSAPDARMHDLGLGDVRTVCARGATSLGAPAALALAGCDSVLADALALSLSCAPPGEPAWFLASASSAQTPFTNGTLCPAAPLSSLGAGTLDAAGALVLDLELAQPPLSSFAAGDTLLLQAVFRDSGFGAGTGTSPALALELQP